MKFFIGSLHTSLMSTSYDSSSSESEGNTSDFDAGGLRPCLSEPESQTHPTGSVDTNQHHKPTPSTRTGNSSWLLWKPTRNVCAAEKLGKYPPSILGRAVCIQGEVLKTK